MSIDPTTIIKPINKFQEHILYETKRNICGSGGYGNGKTYIFCAKLVLLAAYFRNYRSAILRRSGMDLNRTTKETFFKICPPALFDEKKGGKWNEHKGYLRFTNGSEFLFMHLDQYDENLVRGLEINSAFVDQGEEIDENIASHLDSRVGRWDRALPPPADEHKFTRNPFTNVFNIPSYMLIGCNPDRVGHWIYNNYHPDSDYFNELILDPTTGEHYKLSDTHVMYQAATTDNPALSKELVRKLTRKDKAFVKRFVLGEWGITEGTIHNVDKNSILEYDELPTGFLSEITNKGTLWRVMDYGSSAPLCVLWFAAYKSWIFCYREYYKERTLISQHRKNISELSNIPGTTIAERYEGEYADPSIFAKNMQRKEQFWSVADEFLDTGLEAPPIFWRPANNDEYMTRNRIDELLYPDDEIVHPITGDYGAPRLYFIKKSERYPNGCKEVILQTKAQVRVKVDIINGEEQFSDERDTKMVDHAYDPLRYLVGTRPDWKEIKVHKRPTANSFYGLRQHAIRNKFRTTRSTPATAYHVDYERMKDRLEIR